NRVGLELEDLKDKDVVDLGAFECQIEKAAREQGINDSVVSIERRDYFVAKDGEKKTRVLAEGQDMPLKDSSVDLLISHAGPPLAGTKTEDETMDVLRDVERVLRSDGEARFFGNSILHIALENRTPEVLRIAEKHKDDDITLVEAETLNRYREIITAKSREFLEKCGFDIEFVDDNDKTDDENAKRYWILRKRK
ncbi:class I SAM-dependent methyltransferase, partial [Patescibacteria group bacterium]|nr:class I SAM-dependent methyltransferase [Patescibacteria group bacterium]